MTPFDKHEADMESYRSKQTNTQFPLDFSKIRNENLFSDMESNIQTLSPVEARDRKKHVFVFRENPQLEAEKLHNDLVRRRLKQKSIGNIGEVQKKISK